MTQIPVDPARPWTIEDLYDLLMQKIEPDLTHEGIALIDEKYKDETADEKDARGKRYGDAIRLCFRQMDLVFHEMEKGIDTFKHDLLSKMKQTSAAEDADTLKHIEDSFS